MEPGVYRNKWSKVKKSADPKYELSQLSRKVGFSFVDRFYQKGSFEPQYIDLLCEMATSFSDTELNNVAASALFEIIVEKLCDDYEDMPVEAYTAEARCRGARGEARGRRGAGPHGCGASRLRGGEPSGHPR